MFLAHLPKSCPPSLLGKPVFMQPMGAWCLKLPREPTWKNWITVLNRLYCRLNWGLVTWTPSLLLPVRG